MNTYPEYAAVWFEIPTLGMARSRDFYAAVLKDHLRIEEVRPSHETHAGAADRNARLNHSAGKSCAYEAGSTIHLAAPLPIETALRRVGENGGTITSPLSAIPTGRFAQCLDPDGNRFGLFAR